MAAGGACWGWRRTALKMLYSIAGRQLLHWGWSVLPAVRPMRCCPLATALTRSPCWIASSPCSVPLRPKEAAKRREALRRKALQRAHSRVELGEPHNSGLGRLIEAAKNKLHLPLGSDLERMGSGELAPRSPSAAEQAGECGSCGVWSGWAGWWVGC